MAEKHDPMARDAVDGFSGTRREEREEMIRVVEYAHFPRIEFQAANGKTYEVQGDIGLNDEWPIGQRVELRYRAGNPKHTTIAKGWQRLIFSAVFIGFAIACWYAWLGMSPD